MSTSSYFYYRHNRNAEVIILPTMTNNADRLISHGIKVGDTFEFDDLDVADKLAFASGHVAEPETLIVTDIQYESHLDVKDGVRKIYLERGAGK